MASHKREVSPIFFIEMITAEYYQTNYEFQNLVEVHEEDFNKV